MKQQLIVAALLLAWDGAINGTVMWAWFICPIWFLFNLFESATRRPGWGLTLAKIGIPAATLGLLWANAKFQNSLAEAKAQRVVAAVEEYHFACGNYPKKLDEIVPRYLSSVPVAKYCLSPSSPFYYSNFGRPMLYWQVFPPHLRKIYDFETRRWSYLD